MSSVTWFYARLPNKHGSRKHKHTFALEQHVVLISITIMSIPMKADSLPHHKGKVCSVVIYPEGTEVDLPQYYCGQKMLSNWGATSYN